jgi:hypothetical protein
MPHLVRRSLQAICIVAALVLPALAWAGSLTLLGVGGGSSGGGGLDPATTAWVNQVVANGGTVSAGRQTIVNTFITCLKSASLWSTMDRYWLLAGENTQSALTDMVGLSLATNHGSTFTPSQGYTGNGSSFFVDTGYTAGTNYTQNSAVYGGQVQTSRTTATGSPAEFGADNAGFTQNAVLIPYNSSNNFSVVLNATTPSAGSATNAQGSYIISRTGASAGAAYKNGTSFSTFATASTGLPGVTFYVGANHQGGSANSFSTDQISSFFAASGWNSTQATNFESCQNAMMTSIGINVH